MPAFWVFRCQYHKPVAAEEPAELLGSEEVAPLTKSSVNQPGGRGTKMKRIVLSLGNSNEVYITQLHPSTIIKIPELQLDYQMDSNADRQNHASSSPTPGPGAFRRVPQTSKIGIFSGLSNHIQTIDLQLRLT